MFRDVMLAVPAGYAPTGRAEAEFEWWQRGIADIHEAACQAKALEMHWMRELQPEDYEPPQAVEPGIRSGPQLTLRLLDAAREDSGRQRAIVEAGVLFELVGCSRPLCNVSAQLAAPVEGYAQVLYLEAGFAHGHPAWHHLQTRVLPGPTASSAVPARVSSVNQLQRLVDDLAHQHLDIWAPVRMRHSANEVEAAATRDKWLVSPEVAKLRALADLNVLTRQSKVAATAAIARAAQGAQVRELALARSKHPRWGEWAGLPDAELTSLVWAKQLTALAAEFGVSDMAIRKRCDKRNIERPPQGYWLRAGAPEPA